MQPGRNFTDAVRDYYYLTQRGYPPRGFLMLIANRYGLSEAERSILYRGIAPESKNEERRKKAIGPDEASGRDLHIDGFNVLMTIASYLAGKPVFVSSDGFLRDASAMRGKMKYDKKTDEALLLLMEYLSLFNGAQYLYLDVKVGFYGKISERVGELSQRENKDKLPKIIVSRSVDNDLSDLDSGIVATSDSQIIDSTNASVLDLAKHVLMERFHPGFYVVTVES